MNVLFWVDMIGVTLALFCIVLAFGESMWAFLSKRLPNAKEWTKFRGGPSLPPEKSNVFDLESERIARVIRKRK